MLLPGATAVRIRRPYLRSRAFLQTARHMSLNEARARGAVVDIHPEVEEALASNKPVVALETALITHGFPYPANSALALSLENIVKAQGSLPATIGLIDGRVKIGLENKEIERLASKEKGPAKISRRDIAAAMALKSDGGTTCSATLIFAALAGIKVFATGGLGGVHRGGENSMDISADLGELTRCPVALVSAGVKSILDIPRTLEYLETLGVPVLTYGATREFPAFFSRHSGVDVPWNVNDPVKAAEILYKQWQLGMNNGAVFAVPIPEQFEEMGAQIQRAVDQAVAESENNGVSKLGKEVTPWLLSRVGQLTHGTSRASNIALIENTALVGGQIAAEYQKLRNNPCLATPSIPKATAYDSPLPPANLMIIGSSAVDITAQAPGPNKNLTTHSTSPGTISMSLGGVARNVAEASHRILSARSSNLSSLLVSPIGDDAFGRLLVEETTQFGMRVDGFISSNRRTAVCNMFLDNEGSLMSGVADMDITAALEADAVVPLIDKHKPRLVALDGNLSPETIKGVVGHCIRNDIQVFFEPTSVTKSTAIFPAISSSMDHLEGIAPITFVSPNRLELAHIFSNAESLGLTAHPTWWQMIDDLSLGSSFRLDLERLAKLNVDDHDSSRGTLAFLINQGVAQMAIKLLPFFQHLIIKCGEQGVLVVMRISGSGMMKSLWAGVNSEISQRRIIARGSSNECAAIVQHFPPHPVGKVLNVTGAGDSFVGALLANLAHQSYILDNPAGLANAISMAQNAAILSLQSNLAVSPLLSDMK
ncbi:Pseudouridine-5'-phosphate glycosidase [Termitomyces sp. T112]|nr:Pseudouridine-5'-phosphate glycosidase [Termitomyces sp. T112]KAH0590795.1 hypothetical protein H2248_000919 [Termitomyces sp. 'cryptogamus']